MIIDCAHYRDGHRQEEGPMSPAEAAERCSQGGFVWLGLFEPGPDELDEVRRAFGLHELAVEDAQNLHLRPKVELYEDGVIRIYDVLFPATVLLETDAYIRDFIVRSSLNEPISTSEFHLRLGQDLLERYPGCQEHSVRAERDRSRVSERLVQYCLVEVGARQAGVLRIHALQKDLAKHQPRKVHPVQVAAQ